MRWKGSTSDGTDTSGTLIIPEVSHENVLDGVEDFIVSRVSLELVPLYPTSSVIFPFRPLTLALAVPMEA
jgi:hypothetical protein